MKGVGSTITPEQEPCKSLSFREGRGLKAKPLHDESFRYSHGFLFPSEITRVRKFLFSYLDTAPKRPERQRHLNGADGGANEQDQVPSGTDLSVRLGTPLAWAHSSVSTFGARYSPPIQDMSLWHTIEALVEGSDMSMLREGLLLSAFDAVFSRVLTRVVNFRQSHDPRLRLGTQGRSKHPLQQ